MNLYRFYIYVIGLSPFILMAWITSAPLAALATMVRFLRWLRGKSENHLGTMAANNILKEFRQVALKKGYPKKLIDEVTEVHRPRIIREQGKRIYVERHGEDNKFDVFM